MICPWLIDTVVETNNRNSYNDSRRSEKQQFGKCMKKECPFYKHINDKDVCIRAEQTTQDIMPLL